MIERSANGAAVIVLVAESFAEFGSLTPVGGETVAVFEIDPDVPPGTVPDSVIVVDAPDASVTAVEMLPVPEAGEQPDAHVHANVDNAAGTASVTAAPDTADGPAFDTTIEYDNAEPATYADGVGVFVIPRSAISTAVAVLVALLFAELVSVTPVGAATVAVFEIDPDVPPGTVPDKVIVVDAPDARSTAVAMFPVPEAGEQPDAHVHVKLDNAAGTVSATLAPVTADGPAFDTTIAYDNAEPATYADGVAVFVIDRSAWLTTVTLAVGVGPL